MRCGQVTTAAVAPEITCLNDATHRVYWPGRTSIMCDEHVEKAHRIAGAMGFNLATDPMPGAKDAACIWDVPRICPKHGNDLFRCPDANEVIVMKYNLRR